MSTLPEHGKAPSILSVMRIEPKVGRLTLKGNKESLRELSRNTTHDLSNILNSGLGLLII